MVRIRLAARRSASVHPALAAVALFTTTSLAQNNNDGGNNDDDDDGNADPSADNNDPSPTPSEDDEEPDNEPSPPSPTPTPDEDEDEEPPPTPTPSREEEEDEPTPSPTPEDTDEADDSTPTPTTTTAPTRTDEADEVFTSFASLSNAPLIITYPPAAVPPTVNAPFMHRSSAPEGTVFIIVGAILGAFGLGILLWRAIVACLLHRSVRRAALAQHDFDSKAAFPAPPAPFYKYGDHNSALSLSAGGNPRGTRRTNRGPIPSGTPSQSNLFFSPTAAAGAAGNGAGRDSRFLPSGFYATGNSSSPGHTHSISLTNLRPDSRGLSRSAMRDHHTPPESPQFPPSRRDMSMSSLNLAAPPQNGRAPSAYLEDLLDENPSAFPPGNMPPANPQRGSPGPRF